ncbi:MAG: ActS/PrrB/RegB family redox-sensitive histidine kinase [Pseudomonadota bacterium]
MTMAGRNYLFDMRARGDWVRLRTLLFLRWIAVIGQSAAVLIASQALGFQLPLNQCALLISASVCVNVTAWVVHPAEKRLSERGTLFSLFFDLVQLSALLMVTGGLNNPFAVLVLAPVTISATALRLQSTLWLGIAAMGGLALMSSVHLPLIQEDGMALEVPEVYRGGIAAALAVGTVFLALYARRVTVEGYAMSQALNATQLALSREQQLSAIGSLAAAAAHELGTPLATIKLAAGELARELADDDELAEDARLIRQEAERCGDIMHDLSNSARQDSHVRHAPIGAVIEEAASPHTGRGKHIVIRIEGSPIDAEPKDQPMVARSPELIHGLRNLVQNAVDFAEATVWIDVDIDENTLRIAVGDDGKGFSPDILPRLGEPYVSTRSMGERRAGEDGYEGMGLGLFIARTLLERSGGRLSFANGSDRARRQRLKDLPAEQAHPPGAIIEIVWRAADVVVPRSIARGALGENPRISA